MSCDPNDSLKIAVLDFERKCMVDDTSCKTCKNMASRSDCQKNQKSFENNILGHIVLKPLYSCFSDIIFIFNVKA